MAFLRDAEALRLKAYRDTNGTWTIGYGTTGSWIKEGMTITKERAEQLLQDRADQFATTVRNTVKVTLTPTQFAALIAFAYNVGEAAFRGSTLVRLLNSGDYSSVPAQLRRWVFETVNGQKREVRGLVNRREKEVALWLA